MDYLKVSYDEKTTPLTDYPAKLAKFVFDRSHLSLPLKILDIGSGRCEMAIGFRQLGAEVVGLDSSFEAGIYAEKFGIAFIKHEFNPPNPLPINDESYDVVFSKSFIEHMQDPLFFLEECRRVLKPQGKVIILTPDWEANVKIFFDDVTHVKPFTRETMRQSLLICNFKVDKVFRFRQLPLAWRSHSYNFLASLVAPFVPVRTKKKFFRWSRELMLFGSGVKGDK